MICFIKYIGILDNNDKKHYVELKQGLNIITGKSSTGKSAILEIFDYCFGSNSFTIPEGIIREKANYYFLILQFSSFYLVIGRNEYEKSCYIIEFNIKSCDNIIHMISKNLFDKKNKLSIDNFKKELGKYFGINYTIVEEDYADYLFRKRKKPTPSVRSFSSFILQHQNLVANKHALFFRFDEKEKKEQVIDHFKIFLGIVDQEYFIYLMKIEEIKKDIKSINYEMNKNKLIFEKNKMKLKELTDNYTSITGTKLFNASNDEIANNPNKYLENIDIISITLKPSETNYAKEVEQLEQEITSLHFRIRKLGNQKIKIESSVRNSKNFTENIYNSPINQPLEHESSSYACPFCFKESNIIENESNKLIDAINWLNNDLKYSYYMQTAFNEEIYKIENQIKELKKNLIVKENCLDEIKKQDEKLEKNVSISNIALKYKLKIEIILESFMINDNIYLLTKKEKLENNLKTLENNLKKYSIDKEVYEITRNIENYMKEIGENFEFESYFKPINLKFSLDNFDLYHEGKNGRTYLRSMGSGANWLYCHLTLFLALQRLFCERSNRGCLIPPILFLDQPTQVYFPTTIEDQNSEFNPNIIAEKIGRKDRLDEDIKSVTNLFKQLIYFCKKTEKITKVMPQIIVTDHADNLDLGESLDFNSYVRARWRSNGFIN
ncbi:DUF3732 domain-containing protein [Fluviispira vulneris]|uniref:DUF3732 domain-containing protein n=1 Tax=Fluviispira vulneris TaxID=2763012 RepID=UPI001646C6FC|nr:DUF3732 domain-containing protein [Fluviispira vulneris]